MREFEDKPEKMETSGEEIQEDLCAGQNVLGEEEHREYQENQKEDHTESLEGLKDQVKKLEEEKNDLINLMQRIQADFENFRRRTRGEKEDLLKYASEGLITRLLPVLDNFERALTSAKDNGEQKSFIEGVEMIFRQFTQVLTNEGLVPVESVGCKFDPNCHEAVMQMEGEEAQKDTVIEELQKGYRLNGKLIRPSMVKVAK